MITEPSGEIAKSSFAYTAQVIVKSSLRGRGGRIPPLFELKN
jgi:hypothetical protein